MAAKTKARLKGRPSPVSAKIKILLAAVHRLTQAGYRILEDADPQLRIEAACDNVADTLATAERLKPHVVLVDFSDATFPGIDLIKALIARHPEQRILAVAPRDDVIQAEEILLAGARGYTSKSAPIEEIAKAVRLVAHGQNYLDAALAQRIALQKLLGRSDRLRVLSPREYEIFCLLANGSRIKEIAARLNLTNKTVANYHSTIRAKLNARTSEELRAIAARNGVIDR